MVSTLGAVGNAAVASFPVGGSSDRLVQGLIVVLGGENIVATKLLSDTLEWTQEIGEQQRLEFIYRVPGGGAHLAVGNRVLLRIDAVDRFRGTISRLSEAKVRGNPALHIRVEVEDLSSMFERRRVDAPRTFNNETAGFVVRDLVATFLGGEGITTNNVQDGPTLADDTTVEVLKTMKEAMDQICELSGFIWFLDARGDVNFRAPEEKVAPFVLGIDHYLDQAQEAHGTTVPLRLATGTATDAIAQGFKVETTGPVEFVELRALKVDTPAAGNVWCEIRTDDGGEPSDTVLATSEELATADFGSEAVTRFYFPTPPTLTATVQYWLVITADYARSDTDYIGFRYQGSTNPYPDGEEQNFNGTVWSGGAGHDLWFRVYVTRDAPMPLDGSVRVQDSREKYRNRQTVVYNDGASTITVNDTVAQAERAAAEGGSGIYHEVETADDITTSQEATALAEALLRRYGKIARTVEFAIRRDGLRPNQALMINLPAHAVDAEFLIEKVSMRDEGAQRLRWEVSVASDEHLGSVGDFWKKLAGN